MGDVAAAARQASDSDALGWGARAGLTARGAIYLLMGALTLGVALGRSSGETDQRGALQQLSERSGGTVLLVLLAVGFAGYALWRLSEVAFGVTGEGRGAGPRVASLVRALVYASFALSTVTILARGSSGSQGGQQQDLTAKAMDQTGGRYLVGVVGLVVLAVGAKMVHEGVTAAFMKHLRTGGMSAGTRRLVKRLGTVGTVARGIVVGLAGVLVVQAAVTYDAEKARGLDGALGTLAEQPFGKALLVAVALGLVAFGAYGLAEARWRRT